MIPKQVQRFLLKAKQIFHRIPRSLIIAVVLYATIGFLLVPGLIEKQGASILSAKLQRPVSIAAIRFNPFGHIIELDGLTIRETDGQPILALKQAAINLDPIASLFKRTFIVSELRLVDPAVQLIKTPSGKLNLTRLSDDILAASPPKPNAPPLRLLIKHFVLTDGSLSLRDESEQPTFTLNTQHLDLDISDLSTLPSKESLYVFASKLRNQGSITLKGKLSLHPLQSSGTLDIEGLDLIEAWELFRKHWNMTPPEGRLNMTARYSFSHDPSHTHFDLSQGSLHVKSLKLQDANHHSLLNLGEIRLTNLETNSTEHTVKMDSLGLHKGSIHLKRDETGKLDWQTMLEPSLPAAHHNTATAALSTQTVEGRVSTDSTQPGTTSDTPVNPSPWKSILHTLDISEVTVDFNDTGHKPPISAMASIAELALTLKASTEFGGSPLQGIEDVHADVTNITLSSPDNSAPLLNLDSMKLEGGSADLKKREAQARHLAIHGGGVKLTRLATGDIHPFNLMLTGAKSQPSFATARSEKSQAKPESTRIPSSTEVSKAGKTPPAPTWRLALDDFTLRDFDTTYTDPNLNPALRLDLDDLQFTARQLSSHSKTPASFESQLQIRQGGTLKLAGKAQQGGDIKADITIDDMNVVPFKPIIGQFAALSLEDGLFSADLTLNHQRTPSNPLSQISGNAHLNNLKLFEDKGRRKFLNWKALEAKGINFRREPNSLSIESLRLEEPDSVVAIHKDKSTNISAVLKSQKSPPSPDGNPTTNSLATRSLAISINSIRIDKGHMDFSDASLLIPFATRIDDLGGIISDINSDPQSRAKLKLSGDIDDYGEMVANGLLSPLNMKGFSDISVLFENIEMTSLSPYSATFAGRTIKSGNLDLDIKYKIENRQLQSESQLVLEQFELGDTIESPRASSLPLDLAISLLTDSDGKIRASIPMSGNVDAPNFNYGDLVLNAIGTMIKNAVTSPFTALASVFGGDGFDEKGLVAFDPGREQLPPHERQKLAKLVATLSSRDDLQLIIHGRYDNQLDTNALKDHKVRLQLADLMGNNLKQGEEPSEINFTSANAQHALEALAKNQGDLIEATAELHEKETGLTPHRVGIMTSLLGHASSTPDFYEKLYAGLVNGQPLEKGELEALAKRRSQAIQTELLDRHRFDQSRLSIGGIEPTESAPEDRHVTSRLELIAN